MLVYCRSIMTPAFRNPSRLCQSHNVEITTWNNKHNQTRSYCLVAGVDGDLLNTPWPRLRPLEKQITARLWVSSHSSHHFISTSSPALSIQLYLHVFTARHIPHIRSEFLGPGGLYSHFNRTVGWHWTVQHSVVQLLASCECAWQRKAGWTWVSTCVVC